MGATVSAYVIYAARPQTTTAPHPTALNPSALLKQVELNASSLRTLTYRILHCVDVTQANASINDFSNYSGWNHTIVSQAHLPTHTIVSQACIIVCVTRLNPTSRVFRGGHACTCTYVKIGGDGPTRIHQ